MNLERNLLIITVILSMMIWTTREICTRGVAKDVRVIIFYFSVWHFWEIIFLRYAGSVEHFQVADYDCISSGDPAGNGFWRTFISGISDPTHYRYPFIV